MGDEENNWVEIEESRALQYFKDECSKTWNQVANASEKKLGFKDKLKYGLGQKTVQKAISTVGRDNLESQIIEKALDKMINALDKGEIICTKEYKLKKEDKKFYLIVRSENGC